MPRLRSRRRSQEHAGLDWPICGKLGGGLPTLGGSKIGDKVNNTMDLPTSLVFGQSRKRLVRGKLRHAMQRALVGKGAQHQDRRN
jgi:hypothetical protein